MPNGKSRAGFLASSAVVETASKPMYAKKMNAAPPNMPARIPNGKYAPRAGVGTRRQMVVRRVDMADADGNEEENYRQFDRDDDRVDGAGLLRPAHEQSRYQRRLCRPPASLRFPESHPNGCVARLAGMFKLKSVLQDEVKIARPSDADRRCAQRVFQYQAPADDPCQELAHRRIRVRVRAARDRNLARDLGVAERGQRAYDAGNDEGDR